MTDAPRCGPRLIQSDDDLAQGMAHLVAVCPVWARVAPECGAELVGKLLVALARARVVVLHKGHEGGA